MWSTALLVISENSTLVETHPYDTFTFRPVLRGGRGCRINLLITLTLRLQNDAPAIKYATATDFVYSKKQPHSVATVMLVCRSDVSENPLKVGNVNPDLIEESKSQALYGVSMT